MSLLLHYDFNRSKLNRLRNFYTRKVKEFWLSYQWIIIALFWILTFITGYIGYKYYLPLVSNTQGSPTVSNIIYHVIQLFVLQAAFPDNVNIYLQIARFLAPALVTLAGLQALFYVFNSRIDNVLLRFTSNHVIICGLGDRGLAIAKSFFENGEKVTVIDNDLDNINIKFLKRHGVRVISGDATSIDLLKRIRAHYCSYLFATMRDDGENVEIAVNLFKLVRQTRKKRDEKELNTLVSENNPNIVQCFVNIMDPQIRNLLKQHPISTDVFDYFELKFFNTYENASNLVFRKSYITKYLQLAKTEDSSLDIVILGFGEMGQEVYHISLLLFEFLGKKNLHYIIIDSMADKRMSLFQKRYPNLEILSSFTTLNIDINESDFLEEFRDSLHAKTESNMLIFICLDADNVGVSAALSLLPLLKNETIPIFVQTQSESGLATILRSRDIFRLTNNPIVPFGILEDVCSKQILINPSIDFVAKKFHEHYIEHHKKTSIVSDTNPFLIEWELLSEERKDTYRKKVRTLEIILNGFNYRILPNLGKKIHITIFEEEECQIFSKIEHSRWLADRVLNGWRFQEGIKKNDLKTNPLLVEWSELSDEAKIWNINQIKEIPEVLASCNFRLEKIAD